MRNQIKLVVYFILLILLLSNCKKEEDTIKELTFSEKLIGKWERRERLDYSFYLDDEFHEAPQPYWTMSLNADSTYFIQAHIFGEESGAYEVNESDSTVTFTHRTVYGFQVIQCRNDTLAVNYGSGREGPFGAKFVRIE